MRVQILSDLHLEFPGNTIPALALEAELVILAGDLAPVLNAEGSAMSPERWAGADKILYVPGQSRVLRLSDIDVARREELARQCLASMA